MRTVVTGGAGFIPSFLVEELVNRGHDVRVLDDLSTGRLDNLGAVADRIELIEGSILDRDLLAKLAAETDQVFHGAVLSLEESLTDPLKVHEVNATGTLALLDAFRACRFVYLSSSEVYGTAQTPMMGEDHPLDPHTPYAASKLAGEKYAASFAVTHGTDTRIIRPFNAYGPRQRYRDFGGVVSIFAHRLLSRLPITLNAGGTQRRDLTHAADLARGICDIAETDKLRNIPINLGAGTAPSVRDIADELCGQLGMDGTYEVGEARPGDVDELIADVSRARQTIAWVPQVDFATGIADVIDWMRGELTQ